MNMPLEDYALIGDVGTAAGPDCFRLGTAIRAADCKVPKVTRKKGVTAKTAKVVKQSPKAGTSKTVG